MCVFLTYKAKASWEPHPGLIHLEFLRVSDPVPSPLVGSRHLIHITYLWINGQIFLFYETECYILIIRQHPPICHTLNVSLIYSFKPHVTIFRSKFFDISELSLKQSCGIQNKTAEQKHHITKSQMFLSCCHIFCLLTRTDGVNWYLMSSWANYIHWIFQPWIPQNRIFASRQGFLNWDKRTWKGDVHRKM